MEAIILVGGKGTRLKSVVDDVPKPMAPIADRPFLEYLLKWLLQQGVRRAVLSAGYMSDTINKYFSSQYSSHNKHMELTYNIEEVPLGTGGAICSALKRCEASDVIVVNGDTFFDVDLFNLQNNHKACDACISVALKEMSCFDRYGVIETVDNRVVRFREKRFAEQGYINGGIYCINRPRLSGFVLPDKFSFEKFMQDNAGEFVINGFPSTGNFIDIGIPEDYRRAQAVIPQWVKL